MHAWTHGQQGAAAAAGRAQHCRRRSRRRKSSRGESGTTTSRLLKGQLTRYLGASHLLSSLVRSPMCPALRPFSTLSFRHIPQNSACFALAFNTAAACMDHQHRSNAEPFVTTPSLKFTATTQRKAFCSPVYAAGSQCSAPNRNQHIPLHPTPLGSTLPAPPMPPCRSCNGQRTSPAHQSPQTGCPSHAPAQPAAAAAAAVPVAAAAPAPVLRTFTLSVCWVWLAGTCRSQSRAERN